MTPEDRDGLRAPFPASAIGKLPKPKQKDARKGECSECGGWHGLPAVHLDFVGHAATTDRLLAVDPDWTWEPFALNADGLPALDRDGNLWIRLRVCGVTRPGVGDGANMKERIGDAIRNAAMRFGVALDLWAKQDLHDSKTEQEQPAPQNPPPELSALELKLSRMFSLMAEKGIRGDARRAFIGKTFGWDEEKTQATSSNDLNDQQVTAVLAALEALPAVAEVPS